MDVDLRGLVELGILENLGEMLLRLAQHGPLLRLFDLGTTHALCVQLEESVRQPDDVIPGLDDLGVG